MPRLTDAAQIRALLETDRPWAVYALGDLAPGFFVHCAWFGDPRAPALALLYRAFATPVLFTLGAPEAVRPLLDEMDAPPEMYLSIRPEILPLVKARYRVRQQTAMWRMVFDPANYRPVPASQVEALGLPDLLALRRLYADGEAAGEAPDFFIPDMLAQGVFYGVWEGDELIAAAGTHLVAPSEGVGAVGNVYTRRDRRGRGLAARVTSAVTSRLLEMRLRTIALNVNQENAVAVRVYERLGYRHYCPFYEGIAVRP